MKKKLLKLLLFINVFVGIIFVCLIGGGLYQTITVPDNFDSFSALLLVISGVPLILINIVLSFILKKFIRKANDENANL